ncbi:Superfamily II DNA or RNA helicase [Abditibacterium utsteinense]|uniref:Superfamily II DNA or RNA helicase n=1 Tax=Abditibacterium utsteinense TaxID=1960156 RepID=A0A2S8SUY9_9BACT|nr:DEAD/DEAH box helicase family protein [Abditibacterium utsteinense]PQV64615.1 Superfamily II DNA or RNA helicase [Abditibacterium utsteinense]
MFRAHQEAFGQLCFDISEGKVSNVRSIICSITPGGGKSLLPVIAANGLIPRVADKVAWVVPRRSLQEQAEAEFATGKSRELLGNRHLIRKTTGEPDPTRGLSGFCTTYQAIGSNNAFLRDDFDAHRYVLILDEPHHVEEGGAWERALLPLVKRAALTVFMSGTLERGNRRKIGFLQYADSMAGEVVDLSGRGGAVIQYPRAQALFDKAILPIHFELMDGTANWIGRDGKAYGTRLSQAGKDTAEAVYTALKTEFAIHLLDECTNHWLEYRQSHPRSKMLAVTANIEDAKKYLDHMKARGVKAAIATSDDSVLATKNINKFKEIDTKGAIGCLVTVAMAYEGLDVPPVTHIACLTHIRSKPWIEQMIARATRFDAGAGAWEEQMAFVYVPDDRLMCNIIGRMQEEQIVAVKARLEEDEMEERAERLQSENERKTITPVGSGALTRRWSRVGAVPKRQETEPEQHEKHTPSQQEAALREQIQDYCKTVDALFFGRQWGEANKRVIKTFSMSRAHMPLEKLQKVMVWLEEYYPLGSMTRK